MMVNPTSAKNISLPLGMIELSGKTFILPLLTIVLFVMMIVCMGVGAVSIHATDVITIFLYRFGWLSTVDTPAYYENVVLSIRLPRVILGVLVGGCLGVCGAAMQSLFRNPLAEPALLGVSSGASVGAVTVIFFSGFIVSVFGENSLLFITPVCAFMGSIIITVLVYLLATKEARTDMTIMILAGIAVNALAGAVIGVFIFASDDQQVRTILFWMFGSLGGAMWNTLLPTIPIIIAATIAIMFYGYSLNIYMLGEHEANHLGIKVEKMKWLIITLVALGVGTSVSLSGIIGFIGLVVPHLIRLSVGPDNRLLMPASALLGSIMLLGADVIARTIVTPTELPIGLVTSLLGSPFFLFLLIRQKRNVRF